MTGHGPKARTWPLVAAAAAMVVVATGCQVGEAPCGLRVCDIRQAECQRITAQGTACLRGVAPRMVPVNVVSSAAYIKSQTTAALTPAEEHSYQAWNTGLSLWGLAPAGFSSADAAAITAARVAGGYTPDDQSITIIDDGSRFDSRAAVVTLVHEYMHALQDAAFGLAAYGGRFGSDFDRRLASAAMIEGEATTVADMANVGLFGDASHTLPWEDIFAGWKDWARNDVLTSPLPVELAWADFRYPFGTPFTHAAFTTDGWIALDALHNAPPTSARQVMAGYGAVDPTGGPWAEELGQDAVAVLPGFTYFDSDRLGSWIFDLFVARAKPTERPPTTHLRGDVISIYEQPATGSVATVWRLRFATPAEASDVAASLITAPAVGDPPHVMRIQTIGRDVVLITATRADLLAALPSALAFESAPAPSANPAAPAPAAAASAPYRCPRPQ